MGGARGAVALNIPQMHHAVRLYEKLHLIAVDEARELVQGDLTGGLDCQDHCMIPRSGTCADIAASHYYDCIHAKDGRWKLRSSIAVPSYVGMFW